MTKRLLITLLALCLGATSLPGCTSGGTQDETEVAEANDQQFAEEGEGDFADAGDEAGGDEASGDEAPMEEGGTEQAATEDAPPEDMGDDLNLGDEQAPQDGQAVAEEPPPAAPEDDLSLDDAGAEEPQQDVAANEASPPVAEEPPPPTDEPVFDEPAASEPSTEVAANEPPPPVEEPAAPAPVDSFSAPAPAPSYSPLLKIKEAAFTAGDGTTLNRVYIARPKDNWKNVSTKLYGSPDRQADLKKWNPYVRSTGVTVGKKIYYSSPTNPSDGRMLTYYEEQNVPPQTYVSQPGDNLRKVSKNLLGFNDAWREVWSTNLNVESKGDLPAGTELKYWPESAAPTQTLAQNTPPMSEPALPDEAPQIPPDTSMPPPDMNVPPTTPPMDQAANASPTDPTTPGADPLAPPPPMPEDPTAMGTTAAPPAAEPPPPPPPPVEAPRPIKKAPPAADVAMDGGMDADTTMIIGLGGILLIAAAVLFVVIRKNRAKRMDLGQTQV